MPKKKKTIRSMEFGKSIDEYRIRRVQKSTGASRAAVVKMLKSVKNPKKKKSKYKWDGGVQKIRKTPKKYRLKKGNPGTVKAPATVIPGKWTAAKVKRLSNGSVQVKI